MAGRNIAAGDTRLADALTALIEIYGLGPVFDFVRNQPGFCENCGCPIGNDIHYPFNTGACEIKVVK